MVEIIKTKGFNLNRLWLVDKWQKDSGYITKLRGLCKTVELVDFDEMAENVIKAPADAFKHTACIGIHPQVTSAASKDLNGEKLRKELEFQQSKSYRAIGKFSYYWLSYHQRNLAFAWRTGNVCHVTPTSMGVNNGTVLNGSSPNETDDKSLEQFGRKVMGASKC